jgi:endonuclease/exonuclease/phosphatase family metal-dependent hydrolase
MNLPTTRHRSLRSRLATRLGVGAGGLLAIVVLLAGLGVVAPFSASPPVGAAAPPPATLDLLQYNVQFLNPGLPDALFSGHWPNTTARAQEIGRRISCFDIVGLNETVNEDRRREILDAAEANSGACEKPALHPDGRHVAMVDGPDLAPGVIKLPTPDEITSVGSGNQTPIIDDEVTIMTRLPIIATHMQRYQNGSGIDAFAAKGIVHARLWYPGQRAKVAIDVFATHLDQDAGVHDSQVAQLGDFVRAHSAPDRPTIIMGDFNIKGDTTDDPANDTEYSRMMATLRQKVNPNLRDTGFGLGGTNEARDQRIDFVLSANTPMYGGEARVEDFPHPTAAAPHTTLSDHAGVSWSDASWTPADPGTVPGAGEARKVTAQVTRLQSLTNDSCNEFTDYFGRGSIMDGRTGDAKADFGLREGNDVGPDWTVTKDVAAGVGRVGVNLQVDDDDDAVCGGGDDEVDVNPDGKTRLDLTANFENGNVELVDSNGNGRAIGRIGEPIVLDGDKGDERARITFVVDAEPTGTAGPPPSIPIDTDRNVKVQVDRLRALSTDSCNERMDFFGHLELRGSIPTVGKDFGVREGNDINPGWSVEATVPAGVRTVDAVIQVKDDDDAVCGGGDDDVDTNPLNGPSNRAVHLRIDLALQTVILMDEGFRTPQQAVGVAGPLELQGTDGAETGIVDFTVAITPR